MESQNYKGLVAWQKAMALAESVYSISAVMPLEERFGLTAQTRRAAVSIPSNIAEGQGRRTDGEFLNQLSFAHGSVRELETHVMLAQRLRMLTPKVVEQLLSSAGEVGRLVTGLANSIERRSQQRKSKPSGKQDGQRRS
jgi:four helix bundle protein